MIVIDMQNLFLPELLAEFLQSLLRTIQSDDFKTILAVQNC